MVKNKVAPPFKRVEVDLIFGEGISKELDLLDAALHYKIITQAGAWFSFGGNNLAQGRDKCLQELKNSSDLFKKVCDAVQKNIKEEQVSED